MSVRFPEASSGAGRTRSSAAWCRLCPWSRRGLGRLVPLGVPLGLPLGLPLGVALAVAPVSLAHGAEPEAPEAAPPNTWQYADALREDTSPTDDAMADGAAKPPEPGLPSGAEPGSHTIGPLVDPTLIGDTDGVYGRFSGDLDFGLSLGARFGPAQAGVLQAGVHTFSSVGLVGSFSHDLGSETAETLSLSVELDIRPLFLPRWYLDLEQGPAWLDLFVDSLSVGFGGYWATPAAGEFGDTRGLLASLSIGLPLMGSADGLWLRARGSHRISDEESHVLVLVGWHSLVVSPWL